MWGLLKRIACKMTICCKSKCSLEPDIHSQIVYDYYSNKQKQLTLESK